MADNIAGIDPHRDSFTIGVIDANGVEIDHATYQMTGAAIAASLEWLTTHGVGRVGIEGTASWGVHVAVACVAAGFDTREVPPQRSAAQRRARRADKTDYDDAVAAARATLADPDLGSPRCLELFDPIVDEIDAVLTHRRILVTTRTLAIQQVSAQIAKLPIEIRDRIDLECSIENRLNQITELDWDLDTVPPAVAYRLSWLQQFAETDRDTRRQIRQLEARIDDLLDGHHTTLRDEPGIGTIGAATLLCEIGDPTRFATESKFARWCGTGAIAVSTGEGAGQPLRHRLDTGGNRRINSVIHVASVTQGRATPEAIDYLARKRTEGKTAREARRAHKRHLANRIIRRMWNDHNRRIQPIQTAA